MRPAGGRLGASGGTFLTSGVSRGKGIEGPAFHNVKSSWQFGWYHGIKSLRPISARAFTIFCRISRQSFRRDEEGMDRVKRIAGAVSVVF